MKFNADVSISFSMVLTLMLYSFMFSSIPSASSFTICRSTHSHCISSNQHSLKFPSSKASSSQRPSTRTAVQLMGQISDDDSSGDKLENKNVIAQTSWYAAEVFGKLLGSANNSNNNTNISSKTTSIDLTKAPSSIKETLERIKLDNDRYYFLSGKVDSLSYDPKCYFADPFVGFKGTDRFVDNLQNLGSFITKYDVKLLNYHVSENQLEVKTRLMVKLELNLPWRPILAWPWGVSYEIDPDSFLIVSHIESWDIDALEGVKQVFRKPTLSI